MNCRCIYLMKELPSYLFGFPSNWEKQLSHQNGKGSRPPSFLRSLVKTFWKDLISLGFVIVVQVTVE